MNVKPLRANDFIIIIIIIMYTILYTFYMFELIACVIIVNMSPWVN